LSRSTDLLGNRFGDSGVRADPKGTKAAPDDAGVNTENVISVEMEDLSEKDRDDLERELQRELKVRAERRRKKLACFQKTRGGGIKKGDTVKASSPVNSPFTLEVHVHMIDVLVNNKYEADLEGITRTLKDSVCGSVESLRLEFKQESENLTTQVRALIQQLLGEAKGKRDTEVVNTNAMAPSSSTAATHGSRSNPGMTANLGCS
jgi:hypothetical protein